MIWLTLICLILSLGTDYLEFFKYIFDSTFILLLALPRNNNVDVVSSIWNI